MLGPEAHAGGDGGGCGGGGGFGGGGGDTSGGGENLVDSHASAFSAMTASRNNATTLARLVAEAALCLAYHPCGPRQQTALKIGEAIKAMHLRGGLGGRRSTVPF